MMPLLPFTSRPVNVSFAGRSNQSSSSSFFLPPSSSQPPAARPAYKPPYRGYDSYQVGALTPLLHACFEGDTQRAKELLKFHSVNPNTPNRYGLTPLMEVAQKNHQPIARMLLENSGIDISRQNDSGHTAAMLAARKGHLDMVKLLYTAALRQKRQGLIFSQSNNAQETALDIAEKNGHTNVADYLRKKEEEEARRVARHFSTSLSWPGHSPLAGSEKSLAHSTSMPHLKKVRSGLHDLLAQAKISEGTSSASPEQAETSSSRHPRGTFQFSSPLSSLDPDELLGE